MNITESLDGIKRTLRRIETQVSIIQRTNQQARTSPSVLAAKSEGIGIDSRARRAEVPDCYLTRHRQHRHLSRPCRGGRNGPAVTAVVQPMLPAAGLPLRP